MVSDAFAHMSFYHNEEVVCSVTSQSCDHRNDASAVLYNLIVVDPKHNEASETQLQ